MRYNRADAESGKNKLFEVIGSYWPFSAPSEPFWTPCGNLNAYASRVIDLAQFCGMIFDREHSQTSYPHTWVGFWTWAPLERISVDHGEKIVYR